MGGRQRDSTAAWPECSSTVTVSRVGGSYLAIDIGHDRLGAGVVNARGEVLVRDRVVTPKLEVWPALQRLVRRVLAAAPGDGAIESVGVACEGPIDITDGTVHPLNIPALQGFALRDHIAELTGATTALATLAQAGVIAERWIGGARGTRDVMMLLLGDSVEAGVVSNGRLLGGRRGNAGQIGHMIVEPGGAPCRCGAAGCLSAYVSGQALSAEINRPLRRTPQAIVERSGAMIGRAIASAAAVFDLRLVLFAGTLPRVFGPELIDAAGAELDRRLRLGHLRSMPDRSRPLVQLGVATLGREAALVGAAGISRMRAAR